MPAQPGEEERLARELASLHARAMDRLMHCLEVLEREERATSSGSAAEIAALAEREGSLAREAAAVAAAIAGYERSARVGPAASGRPAIRALAREHAALRAKVLERNRTVRTVIETEMAATRREIALRRARVGVPSPFVAIGDAALVDIRT
jgi:uncharacterized membrane protein